MTLNVSSSRLATSSLPPSGRQHQAAWIVAHIDASRNIIRACRKILSKRTLVRVNKAKHARNVDNRDRFHTLAGDVEVRLVGRDCHAKGARRIALQLVERQFHRRANVRTKDGDRIRKRAAVFQMSERNEILGMQVCRNSETPIRRERGVEGVRDEGHCDAVDDHRAGCVDDRDFGFRRQAIAARRRYPRRVRINMRHIEACTVRARRNVTGATARGEALFFDTRLRIQHRNIVGDAVGDEQARAARPLDHTRRFGPHRPCIGHSQRLRVDNRDRVIPRVANQEARPVMRKRDAPRHATYGNGFDGGISGCIEHAHFFTALAEHIESRAIG